MGIVRGAQASDLESINLLCKMFDVHPSFPVLKGMLFYPNVALVYESDSEIKAFVWVLINGPVGYIDYWVSSSPIAGIKVGMEALKLALNRGIERCFSMINTENPNFKSITHFHSKILKASYYRSAYAVSIFNKRELVN